MALPDQELIALLADLESDRVERKESAADSEQLSVAICGFANDLPGYGEPGVLFIGVSDKGAVLGRPITDRLLLKLADRRCGSRVACTSGWGRGERSPHSTSTAVPGCVPSSSHPLSGLCCGQPPISTAPTWYSSTGDMAPLGYVVLGHGVRLNRPVQTYQRWITRIPEVFHDDVLGESEPPPVPDRYCLKQLKHYHSLMPLAQEARKPMFALKPADGAFGGHAQATQRAYDDFHGLAIRIVRDANVGTREVDVGDRS